MKDRVREKLDALKAYPFFESVGKPLLDSSVTQLSDWKLAAKECCSTEWEGCRIMARNAWQLSFEDKFPVKGVTERYQEWNSVAQEIMPAVAVIANSVVTRIPVPDEIRERIKHSLSWDFGYICLESEFSDIVDPIFSIPVLEPWYAAGHFPCGWNGKAFRKVTDALLRKGRLMVF